MAVRKRLWGIYKPTGTKIYATGSGKETRFIANHPKTAGKKYKGAYFIGKDIDNYK